MRKKLVLFGVGLMSCFTLTVMTGQSKAQTDESAAADTTQNGRWTPSPKSAMIRSMIFPGWGQWYNGKKWKAGLAFATETGIVAAAVYWNNRAQKTSDSFLREQYKDYRNSSYWFLAASILLSMGDAYVDAHLAGFDVSSSLADANGGFGFSVSAAYRF